MVQALCTGAGAGSGAGTAPTSAPAPALRPIALRDGLELATLSLLWSSSFLFMRVAAPAFGPLSLIAVRVSVAACLLAPLLRSLRERPRWRALLVPLAVVGLFNSALPFALFAVAALELPAGLSAVLNATAALWSLAIGRAIYRAEVSRAAALGAVLGVLGVLSMMGHRLRWPDEGSGLAAIGAMALALAATLCYGASAHYVRTRLADVPSGVVAAGSQLAAALVLLVPGALAWPQRSPPLEVWAAAIALGALCTAAAYLLYFRLISRIGVPRAMTVTMLVPALGVVLGVALLAEPLSLATVLGGALVLAGSALTMRRPS
jgi:drug/metabolite transporter (DMT)-like permease